MHRNSGADEEVLEVLGEGHKHRVVNLADVERYQPSGALVTRRGDWTPVPSQRGFAAMCAAFLDAVARGRIVSARDALRTHEFCETVVQRAEASVGPS
jgi:virulence factor